ncbi:ATP-dependent DNA helicase Rep [bioreactor metagenome]|uniref:ATP-dependent DNA helicase Rep n=1 Tax=bioreactor metagenome TaxID=1076179 RepID=A0A644Z111_9ZZZZ
MQAKGLEERVHVRHFHKWSRDQLAAYHLLPENPRQYSTAQLMREYVTRLIKGVDDGHVPTGQYHAILIDEGHDFESEWLRLVTRMVDPGTRSLLLLYDDAQSIYDRSKKRGFSLKSVGIEAQGRTTILKINYRNTRQILQLANRIAGDMINAEEQSSEDGIPLLKPMSCGREGPAPIVIDLPLLADRAAQVAELLADHHAQGHAWRDMAVLCRHHDEMHVCELALARKRLPHRVRSRTGDFQPHEDVVQIMTMHASKGLEWPIVAVVGGDAGAVKSSKKDSDPELESRLVYVAAARATHQLLVSLPPEARPTEVTA